MTSPAVERASKSTRTVEDVLAERCPVCNGDGLLMKGPMTEWQNCPRCQGTGKKERSA